MSAARNLPSAARNRRFTGHGIIEPGAHPEFDKPTPQPTPPKRKDYLSRMKSAVGDLAHGYWPGQRSRKP